MGAATRFTFQPGAPLGAFGSISRPEVETIPAASLGQVFVERRSLIFILIRLGTNFIFGAGAQTLGFSAMPVAWVAHLGGFFAGLVLFSLFDRPFRAPPMTGEFATEPPSMEAQPHFAPAFRRTCSGSKEGRPLKRWGGEMISAEYRSAGRRGRRRDDGVHGRCLCALHRLRRRPSAVRGGDLEQRLVSARGFRHHQLHVELGYAPFAAIGSWIGGFLSITALERIQPLRRN